MSHSFNFNTKNNVSFKSHNFPNIWIFKKSQIKIPHLFCTPQKLFILILLKKESLYEVKSLNKKINRNDFCGAWKKCGIFICDFLKKNTDRTCTIWDFLRDFQTEKSHKRNQHKNASFAVGWWQSFISDVSLRAYLTKYSSS